MRSPLPLALTTVVPSQVYTLTTHTILRLGSLISEGATRLRVRKTLRQSTPTGGLVFEVTTLARVQTPAQGAERLTAELAPLLATLLVETDAAGRLLRILNKAQLRRHWATLLPQLQATYRRDPDLSPDLLPQLGQLLSEDDILEATLAHSPEYGLLFPPLYAQTYFPDAPVPGTARLARFVGELDLPLRTEALLAAEPALASGTATIHIAGEVDAQAYSAGEVRRVLCALTDQPNLDTRVAALHQETYTFGAHHELLEASRHTRADIPGVLSQQLTVLLHTHNIQIPRPGYE